MKKRHLAALILAAGFMLGIHEGNVALWKDGTREPLVFPWKAALLPKEDRRKLENGIRIENEDQLIQLLEDYLS